MIIADLKLNSRLLASYGAVRIEGTEDPDSINTYRVIRIFPDIQPTGDDVLIEHRYGDPVESLVQKTLAAGVAAFEAVPRGGCGIDHDARCCRVHGTHHSPHIGCILR